MRPILFFIILLLSLVTSVQAQENLGIGRFFSQIPQSGVHNEYVCMQGNSIKNFNGISLFKSLVVNDAASIVEDIRATVVRDGHEAANVKSIAKDGVTRSFYCQLAPLTEGSKVNRFILFREMGEGSAMLIYMEGTATLDDIVNVKLNRK